MTRDVALLLEATDWFGFEHAFEMDEEEGEPIVLVDGGSHAGGSTAMLDERGRLLVLEAQDNGQLVGYVVQDNGQRVDLLDMVDDIGPPQNASLN